jgi:hypothetical protein
VLPFPLDLDARKRGAMWYLAIVIFAVACADNKDVDLIVPDSPTLVSYRTPTEAWTQPTKSRSARDGLHYPLPGGSDIEILVVCTRSSGSFVAQELFSAPQDLVAALKTWPLPACSTESTEVTVGVSGQVAQAGVVAMGGPPFVQRAMGSTPWLFHFDVALGPNDLIAASADSSTVLIRRNQPITSAFSEPVIDFTIEGAQTGLVAFSIPDLAADEAITLSQVSLATANHTRMDLPGSSASAPVFPKGLLVPGDLQALDVEVAAGPANHQSFRGAWIPVEGDNVDINLPPRLDSILYTTSGVGASWSVLQSPFDSVRVDFGDASGEQSVTATEHWLARDGGSELSFDPVAPGYDPSWTVDPIAAAKVFAVDSTLDSTHFTVEDAVGGAGSASSGTLARKPTRLDAD